MTKYIYILSLFIIFSCSSKKEVAKSSADQVEVLSLIISSSKKKIYFKTITKSFQKPLESYIKPHLLEFYFCREGIESSSIIITETEINFLKNEFGVQPKIKLSKDFKNKVTRKKEKFNTIYISSPIVFRNGTMALYFKNQTFGGGFVLLKKENGEWKFLCSNSVWIE